MFFAVARATLKTSDQLRTFSDGDTCDLNQRRFFTEAQPRTWHAVSRLGDSNGRHQD